MKWVALVLSAWLPIAVAGLVLAAPPDAGVTVQVFKFRPDRIEVKAGTRVFPFFCERHPAMRGEIHVD